MVLRGQVPPWLFPGQFERREKLPTEYFATVYADLSNSQSVLFSENWPQRFQNCANLIIDNQIQDLRRYFEKADPRLARIMAGFREEPVDGKPGRTLLMIAAEQGATDCIGLLIEARAHVDAVDATDQLSALARAAARGWGGVCRCAHRKGSKE
eukprot:COSAG02_NODE_3219_length_7155_cov_4.534864_7_plen_154_part_00